MAFRRFQIQTITIKQFKNSSIPKNKAGRKH
jgi:hypothetical protein